METYRKGTCMTKQITKKQLFRGAFLLTLAGILSKVLSVGYRIPLQNIAGDVGFYIYQQVYPILGMAWMISLYGFPIAISSLVSEYEGKGRVLTVRNFYIPAFIFLLGVSLVLFGVFYLGASMIAIWMGDPQLELPLKVTSLVFLFLPLTSLLRGTFQGLHNMRPTAISQIAEQFTRVLVIIFATYFLVQAGVRLYVVGAGAALGSALGAIVSIIVLISFFLKQSPPLQKETTPSIPYRKLFRTIIIVGLFFCVNYMMLLFLQFADALTLIPNLQEGGLPLEEAKIEKGIFDRGYPLIQIGTVVGSSIALALIPAITKQRLEMREEESYADARSAVKFSFLFSIAATAGLIMVMPYVNVSFFQTDEGTGALRILSLVTLFGSLSLTYSSLLQGFSMVGRPALAVLLAFFVKMGLNELLVPSYGVKGSAISSIVAVLFICLCNYISLKRHFTLRLKHHIPWKQTGYALGTMLLVVWGTSFIYQLVFPLEVRLDYVGMTLLTVSSGAISYFYVLLKTKAFTYEELSQFPFGESMIRKLEDST